MRIQIKYNSHIWFYNSLYRFSLTASTFPVISNNLTPNQMTYIANTHAIKTRGCYTRRIPTYVFKFDFTDVHLRLLDSFLRIDYSLSPRIGEDSSRHDGIYPSRYVWLMSNRYRRRTKSMFVLFRLRRTKHSLGKRFVCDGFV